MDFFSLYYSYLEGCAFVNSFDSPEPGWEWHHTLPQCMFGDIRIGLWLTKEQHARASVYQTLAFDRCCITRFQKKYLPSDWWGLIQPQYNRLIEDRPALMQQALRDSGRYDNPTEAQLSARREIAKKNRERQDWSATCREGGKITNNQRWQCLITGHVSSPGPLTLYQKHRGVDPSMRVRIQ